VAFYTSVLNGEPVPLDARFNVYVSDNAGHPNASPVQNHRCPRSAWIDIAGIGPLVGKGSGLGQKIPENGVFCPWFFRLQL
jgi:hypothetical protein